MRVDAVIFTMAKFQCAKCKKIIKCAIEIHDENRKTKTIKSRRCRICNHVNPVTIITEVFFRHQVAIEGHSGVETECQEVES